MNRTLIGALDGINNLLAIGIIIVGTVGGFISIPNDNAKIVGAILGLINNE